MLICWRQREPVCQNSCPDIDIVSFYHLSYMDIWTTGIVICHADDLASYYCQTQPKIKY